ncbi:MAG: DUF2271 domain-containing protein [Nannocystaceae bacterium]
MRLQLSCARPLRAALLALAAACAPAGGVEIVGVETVDFGHVDTDMSYSTSSSSDAGGDEPTPPPPSTSAGGDTDGAADDGLLVPARATWRVATDAPPADWRAVDFDDSAWTEAAAPLGGAGASDLATEVASTGAPIALYARTTFAVTTPPTTALLHLRRADAAAIYLNGAPVLRSNIVDDAAELAAGGDEGRRYLRFAIDGAALQAGANAIAVEVYRRGAGDPFAFDLQLEAAAADGAYVQLRTATYDGEYGDRNVGAIWIERSDGAYVRTLALWAAVRREHLVRWRTASGDDSADAITSATRSSHRTTALTWELVDGLGAPLEPGDYRLRAEFTEENSNKGAPLGPLLELPFTVGAATATTIPAAPGFRDVTLLTP